MDSFDKDWLAVGRIGQTYGIQGWVKIYSYTNPHTNIVNYHPWHLYQGQQWRPVTVTACKPHGKALIAHFAGCDSPEQANAYVNIEIGIRRQQLPALTTDEYYWADLQGLKVYNIRQQFLGIISHLLETGANDVLVVKKDSQLLLIPYVRHHIVVAISLNENTMIVDWDAEE